MNLRFITLALLVACVVKDDSGNGEEGPLLWYTDCGDPACSGYSGPFDGVELCTDQTPGTTCEPEGATCDPQDDCNALVVCATTDPKEQEGGCPVSLRRFKKDITPLAPDERASLAASLLDTPLYRYRYLDQGPEVAPRLGFLIDDDPTSPAVRPDGGRVDLYGYTSMAVATIQAQQAEIEVLKAELAALRARTEALEAAAASRPLRSPPPATP